MGVKPKPHLSVMCAVPFPATRSSPPKFVSFRRLTKAPLVSLYVQPLAPPSSFSFCLTISPSSFPFSLIPCPVPSTCLPMKEAQNLAHL